MSIATTEDITTYLENRVSIIETAIYSDEFSQDDENDSDFDELIYCICRIPASTITVGDVLPRRKTRSNLDISIDSNLRDVRDSTDKNIEHIYRSVTRSSTEIGDNKIITQRSNRQIIDRDSMLSQIQAREASKRVKRELDRDNILEYSVIPKVMNSANNLSETETISDEHVFITVAFRDRDALLAQFT